MAQVEVISIDAGDYYTSEYTSGSTVNVTLMRGSETVRCEGILIWEAAEQEELDELFEEWRDMAAAGEEGYTYTAE